MGTILEVLLAAGAILAAVAVGITCLIGLAVWLGGAERRPVK